MDRQQNQWFVRDGERSTIPVVYLTIENEKGLAGRCRFGGTIR